jgi:hypothetical protein
MTLVVETMGTGREAFCDEPRKGKARKVRKARKAREARKVRKTNPPRRLAPHLLNPSQSVTPREQICPTQTRSKE